MAEASFRDNLRSDIVAKAGALIEAEGLQALQARRIAREAKCAVGTVYNLFGDIDGLIIAVNATTLEMLGSAIGAQEGSLEALSLEQRLLRLAKAYVRFALDHHKRWEAVFKHRLAEGREVPASYLDDQNRLLAVIEHAISEHVPPSSDQRGIVARALFGAVHGILALAMDNRLGGRSTTEIEAQVRVIVALAARGLEHGGSDGH